MNQVLSLLYSNWKLSMEKSKMENRSFLNNNDSFLEDFIAKLEETTDRSTFKDSVGSFDHQLYEYYAGQNYLKTHSDSITKQLYQPQNKHALIVDVPQNHSLIDSMFKTTFGCEQKLAKSYLQILDQTQKIEGQEKQKRIQEAKNKFAMANSHTDFYANTKGYMNPTQYAKQRPVIDSQHDGYLKTHLVFLQQPNTKSGSKRDYFSRQTDNIAKKITELGGMEDTLEPMQASLRANEVINLKNRQILANKSQEKKALSPYKTTQVDSKSKQDWISKSKHLRENMMAKMCIS